MKIIDSRKKVNKLYSSIRVCETEADRISMLFDNYTNKIETLTDNLKSNLMSIIFQYNQFIRQAEINKEIIEEGSLLFDVSKLFKNENFKNGNDIEKTRINIIDPLFEIISRCKYDERSKILYQFTLNCNQLYIDYTSNRSILKMKLEFILKTYSMQFEIIDKFLKSLKPSA